MKSNKISRWIAWGIFGLVILEIFSLVIMEIAGCQTMVNPSQPTPAMAYGLWMLPLNALGFSILGALIITYHPENRIGWVSLIYGFGFLLGFVGTSYGTCRIVDPLNFLGKAQAIWMINISDLSTIGLAFFIWLFPDGHFLSKRWRRLGLTLFGFTLGFSLLSYFWPGKVSDLLNQEVNNPFAIPITTSSFWDNFIIQGNYIIGAVFMLVGILSLIQRWRRVGGVVRQQMKWLTFFLMTSGILFLGVEIVGVIVFPKIFDGWFYFLELIIFWIGLPIILGLAIFKYRLYDIDIIIRRTLQYALLSGLLALVYFGSVVMLQSLAENLTGQQSPIVIVLSTLAIAALFNPLRTRVQDFIDRRFYRKKYDAQHALAQFADAARDEVDMDQLTAALLSVVDETVQPEQVSLWINTD